MVPIGSKWARYKWSESERLLGQSIGISEDGTYCLGFPGLGNSPGLKTLQICSKQSWWNMTMMVTGWLMVQLLTSF